MFKTGERVRAIKSHSDWFKVGDILTVRSVYPSSGRPSHIHIDHPTQGIRGSFTVDLFEKVENMSFKTGDKVRAVKPYDDWLAIGDIHTVVEGGGASVNINHPTKGVGNFPNGQFELVTNQMLTLTGEIVGDELVLPGGVRVKLPESLLPEDPQLTEMRAKIVNFLRLSKRNYLMTKVADKELDKYIKEAFLNA